MLTELNSTNFDEETKKGVKLIEFHTPWCGYCKRQQLELEEMKKIWIGQINGDNESLLTSKFNVNSYPTFLILKDGQVVDRFSGMRKKEDLMSEIMKHL